MARARVRVRGRRRVDRRARAIAVRIVDEALRLTRGKVGTDEPIERVVAEDLRKICVMLPAASYVISMTFVAAKLVALNSRKRRTRRR